MSIYYFTDLTARWHTWAFMSDASSWGCGIVATRATVGELREESKFCEARGWATSIEDEYTRVEEESHARFDLRTEADQHQHDRVARQGRLGFIELFSGSGRLAATVAMLA
eukprot:5210129-Pyramimonas_sp.AAC.1